MRFRNASTNRHAHKLCVFKAGELLKTEGFQFDLAFCSVLKRSIKTLQFILEELDQLWVPVEKSWKLNERHYGDLQEVSKADTAKKFGEKQLQDWRRGYDSAPARTALILLLLSSFCLEST